MLRRKMVKKQMDLLVKLLVLTKKHIIKNPCIDLDVSMFLDESLGVFFYFFYSINNIVNFLQISL